MRSFEMDPFVITVTLFIAAICLLYKYLTWHYDVFNKLGIAGPQPRLLVGNFPAKEHIVYELDKIYNQYKRNHQVIGVFVSRYPQFLILDPKLAHDVLVTNFRSFKDNFMKEWIYDKKQDKIAAINPVFNTGEDWKNKRSDIMSGLTQNKLSLAYPIWKNCGQKLNDLIKEQTSEGRAILETKNLISRFTANVLGEFLWGIETNTLTNLNEPNSYLKTAEKISHQLFVAVKSYFTVLPFPWFRRFTNHRIFTDEVEKFFSQLTKDSYAMREKDAKNKNRVDYLNYIRQLEEKKNLSHNEIIGYLATVFVDGFDTAAAVAYHTLFYLTHHPDCQDKLRAEILSNLEADGSINYQNLSGLIYLEQCVKETLRIISPLSFSWRLCTEPIELELDNGRRLPIQKGQVVAIPAFSYVHDADYFPEPWEYKPERFNNADYAELSKRGIFMPFGDGPRICLGRHLAYLQVKTSVAEIIKSYRLRARDKTIPKKKPNSQTLILGIDGDFLIEYEGI
ncbi:probable cytochrome P450 309a2 [Eurosta solidaginis]|uniref:probable cytochrome P450 309a2 n=1 Tax=Eurosta solidaginis TaxID=178769 RepID=UPI003531494B